MLHNDIYRYPLRNMNDTDIPFTRLDIFKRSFFPRTLSLWNKLDLETRKSHSLYTFKEGITPKPDKFEYFCHSGDRWAGIHHARIRIGCSKLKSHLHNNLHVIEEESCQCGHWSEDPFHFFFECPLYVTLRKNLFTSVAQHTDCSFTNATVWRSWTKSQTKLRYIWCCAALYYLIKTLWLIPFCGVLLHSIPPPSTTPPHLPRPTQQASRAHDKRDLYNTCIVSQLSRNKYCLNQWHL